MNETQIKALCKITISHCTDKINEWYGTEPKYGSVIANTLSKNKDEIADEVSEKVMEFCNQEDTER